MKFLCMTHILQAFGALRHTFSQITGPLGIPHADVILATVLTGRWFWPSSPAMRWATAMAAVVRLLYATSARSKPCTFVRAMSVA